MKEYTLILAVVATVAFPGLLMAENSNANIAAANEAVQMNDAELDNVTAAGLGKAGAPGQLMKQQFQSLQLTACDKGKSCSAFGQIKKLNALNLGVTHGARDLAPGHNKP